MKKWRPVKILATGEILMRRTTQFDEYKYRGLTESEMQTLHLAEVITEPYTELVREDDPNEEEEMFPLAYSGRY